jgi:nucleotide-binding universal stress UspA family protein
MNAPAGIVDYAQANNIDLIVISSLVHKLERFFLGSTTEKVISYTDTAVFAIPSSAKPA